MSGGDKPVPKPIIKLPDVSTSRGILDRQKAGEGAIKGPGSNDQPGTGQPDTSGKNQLSTKASDVSGSNSGNLLLSEEKSGGKLPGDNHPPQALTSPESQIIKAEEAALLITPVATNPADASVSALTADAPGQAPLMPGDMDFENSSPIDKANPVPVVGEAETKIAGSAPDIQGQSSPIDDDINIESAKQGKTTKPVDDSISLTKETDVQGRPLSHAEVTRRVDEAVDAAFKGSPQYVTDYVKEHIGALSFEDQPGVIHSIEDLARHLKKDGLVIGLDRGSDEKVEQRLQQLTKRLGEWVKDAQKMAQAPQPMVENGKPGSALAADPNRRIQATREPTLPDPRSPEERRHADAAAREDLHKHVLAVRRQRERRRTQMLIALQIALAAAQMSVPHQH